MLTFFCKISLKPDDRKKTLQNSKQPLKSSAYMLSHCTQHHRNQVIVSVNLSDRLLDYNYNTDFPRLFNAFLFLIYIFKASQNGHKDITS